MDKEFEKKVKMKRLRAIGVGVLILVIAVYLILDTDVEKADYAESLSTEITSAHELLEEAGRNTGNEKGQYAPYTILAYQKQISDAEEISGSPDSEYNDKKDAYELLKDKNKEFKKAQNRDVLSKDEVQKLMNDGGEHEYSVEIKKEKNARLFIEGKNFEKAVAVNLMAREEGPYYGDIVDMLSRMELSGQVISLYQDGSFGGKVKAQIPFYTEKETKGYVYKIDLKSGKLVFTSNAKIDADGQTARFAVTEGGDYVVLTKKMHKDAKKPVVDVKKAEKEAEKEDTSKYENSDIASKDTGTKDNPADKPTEPSDKPKEAKFEVTLEIRCDTLAQDISKLEDPALKPYVPADGTILPVTEVKVKEGDTVFDVLNRVCRNKGIQLESVYTPAYGSYYVEGINYLYEFDGGKLSGWMYKVNDRFPNYGSSEYKLKDGDRITWLYTCDLGKDIGGSNAVS